MALNTIAHNNEKCSSSGDNGPGLAQAKTLEHSARLDPLTRWPFVIVIVCVMAVGAVFMFLAAREAEEVMKRTMLSQARMLVESIDQGRFSRLTATLADEQSPDYHALHDTLARMRAANPTYRYLYLMGKVTSGPPFFYMGSAPAGSDDYSPPGQPYPEEAPTLAHVFAAEEAALSDPVTDRWGTWVSALVPLRDRKTGRMLAVFGMDVDASDWQASVRTRVLLTGALTLVVVFLVLLLFFVLRNRQRSRTEHLLLDKNRLLGVQAAELKDSSERMQAQKDRYGFIIESTNLGTWEWNVQTGETVFNELFVGMAGYTLAELAPISFKTWEYLAHPDDLRASNLALERHFNGETEFYECECRIRHKDGRWVWVLDRGKVISRTQDGKPLWAYGTHQDLSERKQLEVELKGSEERARRQRAAIVTLALDASIMEADVPTAIPQVAKIVALSMEVARAGVWMLSEDGSELRCLSLYEAGPDRFSQGMVLRTTEFPCYFQALLGESRISVHDAQSDPRMSEMTPEYLAPLGITSMLDACIQSEGRLAGVVCLEHIGSPRGWKTDEEAFASTVAGIVAQIMANDRRRQAEMALRQSEELQRSLIKSMPDLVVRTDMQGRIVFINQYECRIMESFPRERIYGESIFSFVAEEDRLRAMDNARQRLESDIGPQEYSLQYGSGPIIDAEVNGALVGDTEGHAVGMIFVIRDISDRKRVERELHQANLVVENSPAILFRWRAADNWPILMVSRNISQFGYLQEDLLSGAVTYTDLVHPDDVERMNSEIEHYTSNNIDRYRQEYRVVTRGGEVRWVDDRTTVIRGADGQVIEYQGIVLDITERKQAEQQLQRQTALFQNLFKSSPEAIAVLDHEDRVLEINHSFETLFGYCQTEARGQDINDLIAPEPYREDALNVSERVVREGHVVEKEAIRCAKDGHPVAVSLIGYPLIEDKKQIGAFAIYRDITDYKKMQELMIQTEKMVSVGGIAAGIAHEINNPLGIVLQASQNLAQRMRLDFPKNQEVARGLGLDVNVMGQYVQARKLDVFLEDIQSGAKRAATIIRQMLDFTRRSESRRTLCNPADLVRTALTLVQSDYDLKKNYDFKKIQVNFVEEEGLPSVLCTETEIEQVLLNVLRNAAQAMAEAVPPIVDPCINIRLSSASGVIRMEFADNGPGIPADTLGRIFEPFFTTKGPGKGTGLGLSVSYFIITQGHGGRMYVESAPGEGARFCIELPVSAAVS